MVGYLSIVFRSRCNYIYIICYSIQNNISTNIRHICSTVWQRRWLGVSLKPQARFLFLARSLLAPRPLPAHSLRRHRPSKGKGQQPQPSPPTTTTNTTTGHHDTLREKSDLDQKDPKGHPTYHHHQQLQQQQQLQQHPNHTTPRETAAAAAAAHGNCSRQQRWL